ncbi:hypothetical protein DL96DRAFT_1617678 [Flagelloscypha sp. PMI_526]|nr:hypothetical protein DL96DRAFT_1617678 [Flagelloscypha sp. PMI_526]
MDTSYPRIPSELFPEILSQLGDLEHEASVRKTLVSSALVARHFLEPCRQLLYSRITIYSHAPSRGHGLTFSDFPSCLDFLRRHPHLARHATALNISRSGENWNDEIPAAWEEVEGGIYLSRTCSLLPNLRSASIGGYTGSWTDVLKEHIGVAILSSLPPSLFSLSFELYVMFASTTQFLSLLSRFTGLTSLKLESITVGNGRSWNAEQICKSPRSTISPIRSLVVDGLTRILARDLVDYLLHPESPHPAHQLHHLHVEFKDQFLVARILEAQTSSYLQRLEISHISESAKRKGSSVHRRRPVEFTSLKRFTSLKQVQIYSLLFTESIRWILDLTTYNEAHPDVQTRISLSFGTCKSTDVLYDPEEWKTLDNQLSRWSNLEMLTLDITPQKFGEEKTFPLLEKLVKAGKVNVPAPWCFCCDEFADSDDEDDVDEDGSDSWATDASDSDKE